MQTYDFPFCKARSLKCILVRFFPFPHLFSTCVFSVSLYPLVLFSSKDDYSIYSLFSPIIKQGDIIKHMGLSKPYLLKMRSMTNSVSTTRSLLEM